MASIAALIWLGVGIVQMAAVYGGLNEWMGLPWILALPASFVVGYIPLLGTFLGIMCAVHVWNWSWLFACAVFLPGLILAALMLGWEAMTRSSRSKREVRRIQAGGL